MLGRQSLLPSSNLTHTHTKMIHCSINRPYRMTCQNFGKANRLGYVKILILFMTKAVDIFN